MPPSPCEIAIIGAGAAGLFCAGELARRGRRVCCIDHRPDFAQKLRRSGGGRCNFSNRRMESSRFLSANPHFVTSALARFPPEAMIALLQEEAIPFAEEAEGQLFLRLPAARLAEVLADRARHAGAEIVIGSVEAVRHAGRFRLQGPFGEIAAEALVVATGGLSWPSLGASDGGHCIARQFGHAIVPCRPGLVPLLLGGEERARFGALGGIAVRARVTMGKRTIVDDCLFTHRGLSGPAILRISSHWGRGMPIAIDCFPDEELGERLEEERLRGSRQQLRTAITRRLPDRLAAALCKECDPTRPLATFSKRELQRTAARLTDLPLHPTGTAGYAKAEVTVGGVETRECSSKTMESKLHAGLFFIGEVLDVAGDLGGFNLHWAWASAHAAAEALSSKR